MVVPFYTTARPLLSMMSPVTHPLAFSKSTNNHNHEEDDDHHADHAYRLPSTVKPVSPPVTQCPLIIPTPTTTTASTWTISAPPLTTRQQQQVTIVVVLLALCIAVVVPNVELIFALTGATASMLLAYILPAAIFLRVLQLRASGLLCGDMGGLLGGGGLGGGVLGGSKAVSGGVVGVPSTSSPGQQGARAGRAGYCVVAHIYVAWRAHHCPPQPPTDSTSQRAFCG